MKGYPDLTLCHRVHGVIFAELKAEDGSTTADQDAWLEDLTAAGARAFVWRPSDWSAIVALLIRGEA
jgi:hypothetical protein